LRFDFRETVAPTLPVLALGRQEWRKLLPLHPVGSTPAVRRMDLHELIARYGGWIYAVAFAWAFLEGETFVLFGGAAAAQGLLDPWLLGITVAIGSFCGDQCWFLLGRRFGAPLLERFPRWRSRVASPLAWLVRYDRWFILSYRFIYGVRNISSFALGLSPVSRQRFLRLNLLGSFIWAASFVAAGYGLIGLYGMALGDLPQNLGLAILGAVVLAVALFRIAHRRDAARRRRSAEAARAASEIF
jgi:membrane protein DedA with SNARE-associated domain